VATRLDRAGLVAWDVYLGFRSSLVWEEEIPEPAGWVHQMGDAAWVGDREHAVAHELEMRLRNVLDAIDPARAEAERTG
jgi:hypothetical protein